MTLDSAGGDEMLRVSRANVGKPMAVVFIEQRSETVEVDGKPVTRNIKDEKSHQRRDHPGSCSATAS